MAMKNNNTTLGRGLSALIDSNTLEGYKEVDITEIVANPYQPRLDPRKKIEKLAKSISEFGIISPLIVIKLEDGKYQLIAGERRLNAAIMAGLQKVPIIIKDNVQNSDMLVIAIIENLQREDLNLIEKATAISELVNEFDMKMPEIAKKLNISIAQTEHLYSISKLSEYVKEGIKKNDISIKQALAIRRLPTEEDQLYVIKKIIEDHLTDEKTRELVVNIIAEKYNVINNSYVISTKQTFDMQNYLKEYLNIGKVEIKRSFSGMGYIKIPFTTDEELDKIFKKLKHK